MSSSFTSKKAKTSTSKTLSWLLRHGAKKEGLTISEDGYVLVEELLTHKNCRSITVEQLHEIVDTCAKQRYGLKETENGHLYIRANQGHSKGIIKTELLLEAITDAAEHSVVCHGSYYEAWPLIQKSGLSRMSREHVHFSAFEPDSKATISGMRTSCEIVIYIDMAAAMRDGIKFYKSSNIVILTDGNATGLVPFKYFTKVIDLATQQDILNVELNENGQVFDYIAVLDFEATCDNKTKLAPQEIIEFPVVVFDTKTNKLVAENHTFHSYVRPVHHPTLTAFCTELTGIEQPTVDSAPDFKTVAAQFDTWFTTHYGDKKVAFVTCGDWDLRTCAPKQYQVIGRNMPSYFGTWINIKTIFKDCTGKKARGMVGMLTDLKLKLVGRHHSGIDDVKNIVRIAQNIVAKKTVFRITSYKNEKGKKNNNAGAKKRKGKQKQRQDS